MEYVEFAANQSAHLDDLDIMDFDLQKMVSEKLVKEIHSMMTGPHRDKVSNILEQVRREIITPGDKKNIQKLQKITNIIMRQEPTQINQHNVMTIAKILKTMNIKTLNTMLWRFTNMDIIQYLSRKNIITKTTMSDLYQNPNNLDLIEQIKQISTRRMPKYKFNEILQKRTKSDVSTLVDILKLLDVVPPNIVKDAIEITQQRLDA